MHFVNGFKLLYEKIDCADGKIKIFASKEHAPIDKDLPLDIYENGFSTNGATQLVKDGKVFKLVYEGDEVKDIRASEDLLPSEDDTILPLTAGGEVILGEKDTVHVKEVKVSETNVTLKIGETKQLTASVLPEDADIKKVTFVGTRPDIATVSEDGLITAVAEGTFTAKAGADQVSTEITITVVPANKKPEADGGEPTESEAPAKKRTKK